VVIQSTDFDSVQARSTSVLRPSDISSGPGYRGAAHQRCQKGRTMRSRDRTPSAEESYGCSTAD
jgi:hypothetical protein